MRMALPNGSAICLRISLIPLMDATLDGPISIFAKVTNWGVPR